MTIGSIRGSSKAFVVLSVLLLGACATVPLKTAWKMRKVTPETLLEAEPGEVRAAVQLDRRSELDVSNTTVDMVFQGKEGPDKEFAIPLRSLTKGESVHVELPDAPPGRYWMLLGFTPEGRDRMVEVQRIAREELDRYSGMSFGIAARFGEEDSPPGLPADPVQFWIRLTPELGFLKVFDGRIDPGEG